MSPKVAVIGGGISGLSAAYFLRQLLGDDLDLTVLDAEPVLGGKLRTRTVAGLPVDTGPDAFLSRAPELKALVDGLGLRGEIVGPAATGAFIWSRGKLRPLPAGATFGLPERVLPMVRSGLISIPGAARAALDLVLPTSRQPADPSVEELVRPDSAPRCTSAWWSPCSAACTPAVRRSSAHEAPCPRSCRWPRPDGA